MFTHLSVKYMVYKDGKYVGTIQANSRQLAIEEAMKNFAATPSQLTITEFDNSYRNKLMDDFHAT